MPEDADGSGSEFVVPNDGDHGEPPEDWDDDPGPADPAGRQLIGAAILQLGAAVLCVVAPFLAVWTLSGQDALDQVAGNRSELSTNGWGVPSVAGNGHGPVFGVIVALAAVPLLAAAVLRLREVVFERARPAGSDPQWWSAEPARSLGIAGSALLLGGAASFVLTAINIVSQADQVGVSGARASIGLGSWLAVVAWVASAVAIALSEHVQGRQRRALELELALE